LWSSQRNNLDGRRRSLLKYVLAAIAAALLIRVCAPPQWALASTGGGGGSSSSVARNALSMVSTLPSLIRRTAGMSVAVLHRTVAKRPLTSLLWTMVAALLVAAQWDVRATLRRQSVDPTSEWSRYANYPAARGQAIAHLVGVQLLPIGVQLAFWSVLASRQARNDPNSRYSRRYDALQTKAGRLLADGLLRLGPLYIKIGQIVSCRRDQVLPVQWQTALERLQDQVPAQSGQQAQQLAYGTWPGGAASFDATFDHVDWTPLAAASLGQVHRAVLTATGDAVALKLQRPMLRQIYDRDFALLTKVAVIVDKWFGSSAGSVGGVQQSWTDIFNDAKAIMMREIDYRAEALHGLRFASDFGLTKGGQALPEGAQATARNGQALPSAASWLRTPYVYANLSTEQVLVMEYVSSVKITAMAKLDEAGVTAADKEYLADCLGRSYLRQFCCNKFCT
jgi:ABC1 atypical kinase-like domain